MAMLDSLNSIDRAATLEGAVPDEALILIEVNRQVFKITFGELKAVAGGSPSPGNLYLADGTTNSFADVEYVDNQYQFVDSTKLVCQGGLGTLLPYAMDGSTSILAPGFRPFADDGSGHANAVAFTTPIHGIVVMGEEFPVTGGTVTMVVTNNVVSATFTPD